MRIVIIAAGMCVSCSAYAAIPCHTGKTGDAYWSWREIDGRRCWYRGRPGKPKDQLYWETTAKSTTARSTTSPAPQAPATSPVVYLHVTPTNPATSPDILRAQPMTEGVLVETPGAIIPDAVPREADTCCWPPLEDLPFAERWDNVPKLLRAQSKADAGIR
jgi:hypothetical protein